MSHNKNKSGRSKVIKSKNYSWEGIDKHQYKTKGTGFKDIHRYSLLTDDFPELNAHTRYFEIQAGGYSSLEFHRHPHSVIVLRGSGSVILENEIHEIGLHDLVFISPGTIHQFQADKNSPLGFLCIVDRYRDKPVLPDENLIEQRIKDPRIKVKIKKKS